MLFGVAVMVALWQARQEWMLRPVHPRDGPLAPGEPLQSEMDPPVTVRQSRWELTERAHYDVTARILSREDYRFDALADLIPEDLALGWGPMSDNQVLRHFEITQAARFYSWRPLGPLPLPAQVVTEHSANTHVIPADAQVRAELRQLRVGQVVRLTGVLVDGRRDDGARVRTSLTRSDSGAGACEIMLVEQVEVR
jgi:hypothetical protein